MTTKLKLRGEGGGRETSTEQNELNLRTPVEKNCLQVLPNYLVGLRKTRTLIQVHQSVSHLM